MAQSKLQGDGLREAVLAVADELHKKLGPRLTVDEMEAHFVDEVTRRSIRITRRNDTRLTFGGRPVEKNLADVLLEDRLLVEFKRLPHVTPADLYRFAQFLKTSKIGEGMLINLSASGQECCYMNVPDN